MPKFSDTRFGMEIRPIIGWRKGDYLPIDAQQKQLFNSIDGERTIGEIACRHGDSDTARTLFERLWWYDQVVFNAPRHESLSSEAKASEL